MSEFELSYKIFHLLCITATAFLICFCIYTYSQDLDLCLVDYRKYDDTTENMKPIVSLCFLEPLVESKMLQYGPEVNLSSYSEFLKGELWDERMLEIDLDNVTLKLEDFLMGYTITWSNFSIMVYDVSDPQLKKL